MGSTIRHIWLHAKHGDYVLQGLCREMSGGVLGQFTIPQGSTQDFIEFGGGNCRALDQVEHSFQNCEMESLRWDSTHDPASWSNSGPAPWQGIRKLRTHVREFRGCTGSYVTLPGFTQQYFECGLFVKGIPTAAIAEEDLPKVTVGADADCRRRRRRLLERLQLQN